jgi:hypothetical protein
MVRYEVKARPGNRNEELVRDVYDELLRIRPDGLGAMRLIPPDSRDTPRLEATARLCRRDLLGGLFREYEAA